MKTCNWFIKINATKEKIWKILWDDSSYRDWTSAFTPGSYMVVESWEKGGKVLFLSPSGDGMYSLINDHIPNKLMSFKHIGMVKNNEEQPIDEETKKWSGCMENYRLENEGALTILEVQLDTEEAHEEMMEKMFMNAFERVKFLSER